MEILIQTKKAIWHISKKGIRRVDTWEWSKVRETFEALFIQQETVLKEALKRQGPMIQGIERAVRGGYESAMKNDIAWREKSAWRDAGDNRLP